MKSLGVLITSVAIALSMASVPVSKGSDISAENRTENGLVYQVVCEGTSLYSEQEEALEANVLNGISDTSDLYVKAVDVYVKRDVVETGNGDTSKFDFTAIFLMYSDTDVRGVYYWHETGRCWVEAKIVSHKGSNVGVDFPGYCKINFLMSKNSVSEYYTSSTSDILLWVFCIVILLVLVVFFGWKTIKRIISSVKKC